MNWIKKDLEHIWHPCSQMKDYETLKPIIIEKGSGVYLYDIFGKKYIDIISSWWCNLFGHTNEYINQKIKGQLDQLEHVIFANFSHKPAIELCYRLNKIMPKGLKKYKFSDSGSSAVEIALKISHQYWQQKGFPEKVKIMSLTNGYHGETIGALSVGGVDKFTETYKKMLMKITVDIEAPDCYRCKYKRSRANCNIECFEEVKSQFSKYGKETAAIIIEPLVQGSSGMRIYPAEYINKLKSLCDKYNVHLIVDEIATGYWRTGKMFALNHTNVTPDIMCIGKGLTGGYLPMALTVTTDEIYNAFYGDYKEDIAFMHSHTYSGNPLACSAALAVLDLLEKDEMISYIEDIQDHMRERVHKEFNNFKNIGDIRSIGGINALEIVENKKTKESFDSSKRVGYEIYKIALKNGLLLRPLGDVLYFNPPLNIKKEEFEEALRICKLSIEEVLGNQE